MASHRSGETQEVSCNVLVGVPSNMQTCMFDGMLVRPYAQRGIRETVRKTRPNAVLQGRPWKKPTLRLHACSGSHLVEGVLPVLVFLESSTKIIEDHLKITEIHGKYMKIIRNHRKSPKINKDH